MILDASVTAKWILADSGEPLQEAANRILQECLRGTVSASVPDLFWPEMANLLARAARRGRIAPAAASAGITLLHGAGLSTKPTLHLTDLALKLAIRWQMPAYAFFYVLLAVETGDQLVTADERLWRGLGAHFSVRWLGAVA